MTHTGLAIICSPSNSSSVIIPSHVLHQCFKYAITSLPFISTTPLNPGHISWGPCNVIIQQTWLINKEILPYSEHCSPKQNGYCCNKMERRIQMSKKVMLTKEFQCDFHIMESVQIYPIPFIYFKYHYGICWLLVGNYMI